VQQGAGQPAGGEAQDRQGQSVKAAVRGPSRSSKVRRSRQAMAKTCIGAFSVMPQPLDGDWG
jgi:hypothetical protein